MHQDHWELKFREAQEEIQRMSLCLAEQSAKVVELTTILKERHWGSIHCMTRGCHICKALGIEEKQI